MPIHAMLQPVTVNTILYCTDWADTVAFYRDRLGFPVTHANDWFVEFALTPTTRLSIADERRATVKSAHGAGITLTFQVSDADAVWQQFRADGLQPTPCRDHAWGARVFYLRDPEGHRLEIWSSQPG
jgi:catechol 2,3-dioxygenase-like lactoylglutathione lyase family enzyme